MSYDIDFFYTLKGIDTLMEGLLVTLQLSLTSIVIGVSLGFVVALMVMSPSKLLSWPATSFIEIFRCTPALIQIVWIFYCVPMLFNVFLDPIVMGVLALSLNLIAFNAEAYRAAIQAIPKAQLDASVALGLNKIQTNVYVVLPQAIRLALPVLVTNGISIFQQSALVAIVAIEDLMYMGKMLSTETYRPIETFTVVALIYFAIALPAMYISSQLEKRLKVA
ncbi:amino acid ABC transporter permease [Marinomonas communis]|uniref:Amino acid ABC transporter membrane protein 1 (PAAT family) n=1 Tax=Marinomonas communis TaxID=28254 RepID=A0A4R6XCM0_9GAMM|nr:amino acid ABC transporter permease [Marinomonas communis]TDR14927.1 amino acid ABC transporter membrane protein 1 (PAAT family) [Marinomonas communis]